MYRAITSLKGVGPARATALESAGIRTISDLLYYLPRRYLDRTIVDTTALRAGDMITLLVHVSNSYVAHGRRSRLTVHCRTASEEPLSLLFFRGVQYFRRVFQQESTFIVSGKLENHRGAQMVHPDFEELDSEDDQLLHMGRIVPLYPSTEKLKKSGLDSRGFRRLASVAFEDTKLEIPETMPDIVRERRKLLDRMSALREMHFPESEASLQGARHYIKYEELFLFQQMMQERRQERKKIIRQCRPLPAGSSVSWTEVKARLPFQLTGAQEKSINELLSCSEKNYPESFLLQGDVGSGKTLTALAVALHYIDAEYQVAFMAPTEVLARQHYNVFTDLLGIGGAAHIEILTGQSGKKARTEARDRIARGDSNLIIGTHSLIEDDLLFKQLGLVIIDEQHRFGVEQREKLQRKGENPDLIVMTATPIPRTLSLTAFADLQLVYLDEKPAGRKPVQTMQLSEERRAAMYKSVAKHVGAGRQCYIVYPVIDESEKLDLRAAADACEELKNIFPDFRIDLLHGRLKARERDRVMQEFRNGHIQILAATTVIEVGVDVPNATIMIIEHAERFGLSQLHQLRGRVGRGEEESFCVLMTDARAGEEAEARLQAMTESQDGFYLAEKDMEIRGVGQLLGLKQHGLSGFLLADLRADQSLVLECRQDVTDVANITEDVDMTSSGRRIVMERFVPETDEE